MKIECAELDRKRYRELRRQRQQVVDKYETDKAAYTEQAAKYRNDYREYTDAIIAEIKAAFAKELEAFPGVNISVKDIFTDEDLIGFIGRKPSYVIQISYRSPKADRETASYSWRPSGSFYVPHGHSGLNWIFEIRLESTHDGTGNEVFRVYKDPAVKVDELDAADYPMLAAMYSLFTKIDQFDWEGLLNRIYKEAPKADEQITTEAPGRKADTEALDKELSQFQVLDYIGKDVWIKAQYRANSNSHPESMWVKFLSLNRTGKKCRVRYLLTYGDAWDDPVANAYRSWNYVRTGELRVGGFSFPQPLTVLTEEEIEPAITR